MDEHHLQHQMLVFVMPFSLYGSNHMLSATWQVLYLYVLGDRNEGKHTKDEKTVIIFVLCHVLFGANRISAA